MEIMSNIHADLTNNKLLNCKTIFYLIDEFEGMFDWHSKKLYCPLIKYSNNKYTFKICMRPDGIKNIRNCRGRIY